MDSPLTHEFFYAMSRFKKTESFFSTECDMQMNELVILQSIAGDCECMECLSANLDVPAIQEKLQITKPAVSYILNTLEKKCYISREIDPRDRRKITIAATLEGKAVVRQSLRARNDMWEKLLAQYGEENMRHLIALLTRLADVFGAMQCEK